MATAKAVAATGPVFVAVALLERFGPVHGTRPSWAAHFKGLLFQLIGPVVGSVLVVLFWRWLPHFRPAFPALSIVAALLIGDFLHYWEHRFEHMFLWRFHAVHHSTRDLSGLSGFHHFTNGLIYSVLYGVPMSLVTTDPWAPPAVVLFLNVLATFTHSPTKLSIGPLRLIFQDNRLHRIHHSTQKAHYDKNLGIVFNFWDILFGTIHWPAKDEWPETGVPDHGEIETVAEFLLIPFRPRQSLTPPRTAD